jgi:hypothetical protein
MLRVAFGILFLVSAVLAGTVTVNGLRFPARIHREVAPMWAAAAGPRSLASVSAPGLPEPVRRYLAQAIGRHGATVATVRLRHGGTFRNGLEGAWQPIRGEQYFAADPPGFVWWGRIRPLPGLWIDARDRCLEGRGSMRVALESSLTLFERTGPEIDQGGLLRLLGEMAWFPTAFLDERYVTWTAIDAAHARAALRVGGREVAGVFAFGPDGLLATFSAERYLDTGRGAAVLRPWSGELGDYREVAGMRVPHRMAACWHVGEQRVPYARFEVERIEYDVTQPY